MSRPQTTGSARVRAASDRLSAEVPAAKPVRDPSWRAHLVWLGDQGERHHRAGEQVAAGIGEPLLARGCEYGHLRFRHCISPRRRRSLGGARSEDWKVSRRVGGQDSHPR